MDLYSRYQNPIPKHTNRVGRRCLDMNGTGHLLTGIIVAVCITHDPAEIAGLTIGSLLPDIDCPTSTLGRFNPFARFMCHRGHTHTIIGAFIISAPFMLISPQVYGMAVAGSMVHILGDKVYSWFPGHSKFKIHLWRGQSNCRKYKKYVYGKK